MDSQNSVCGCRSQVSEKTGFLEESPGVRSMARLTIAVLLALTTAVVGTLLWYVITKDRQPAVIAALTSAIGALVLNGIVAIYKRNSGCDEQK